MIYPITFFILYLLIFKNNHPYNLLKLFQFFFYLFNMNKNRKHLTYSSFSLMTIKQFQKHMNLISIQVLHLYHLSIDKASIMEINIILINPNFNIKFKD